MKKSCKNCNEVNELKLVLSEFNWRWNRVLKSECTQTEFSRRFRKFIKQRIGGWEAKK